MAQIAFILLCHKDPNAVIAQAQRLTVTGDCVAIHMDSRASSASFEQIQTAVADNPLIALVGKRVKCGWGEWSLVQATINACDTALRAFPRATHLYMLSGDCMPIKSARHAHAMLDGKSVDYIESFDFFESDWIKTGMRGERLIYRHLFNERSQKWLFYQSLDLQKRLGLTRPIPEGVRVRIGSQWWCLRRKSVEAILAFCRQRRDVPRFFATTWIPDETFFQTVIRLVVPKAEIESRTLTFLMFTDYGMPVTFHNDHHDLLLSQDALFARKISPEATELRSRLGEVWADADRRFEIAGDGRRLMGFLTGQGRIGQRFAPRAWERGAAMTKGERLILLACKKWHIAQRLAHRIEAETALATYGYVFNEEDVALPDLGGIETGLGKRTRHRRAFIRLMFDATEEDRLVFCVDPAAGDLVEDLAADRGEVRVLDIACAMDDDWLKGHARRIGLIGDSTADTALDQILPTLRRAIAREADRLAEAPVNRFARLTQARDIAQNALSLAEILDISEPAATRILADDHLFDD